MYFSHELNFYEYHTKLLNFLMDESEYNSFDNHHLVTAYFLYFHLLYFYNFDDFIMKYGQTSAWYFI